MQTVPRRRWFQVSLAEWLILTTLLGLAWWQCARWPVADTELRQVSDGSSPPPLKVENGVVSGAWRLQYFVTKKFAIQRTPTRREIAVRVALSSAAIIGVWLVGSITVRAIIRRRSVPHS